MQYPTLYMPSINSPSKFSTFNNFFFADKKNNSNYNYRNKSQEYNILNNFFSIKGRKYIGNRINSENNIIFKKSNSINKLNYSNPSNVNKINTVSNNSKYETYSNELKNKNFNNFKTNFRKNISHMGKIIIKNFIYVLKN